MSKCEKCLYYRRLQLIKKYLPYIILEALTTAMNSGIIEDTVNDALKKLLDEDNDCCD